MDGAYFWEFKGKKLIFGAKLDGLDLWIVFEWKFRAKPSIETKYLHLV
jgi:hypothetical protein